MSKKTKEETQLRESLGFGKVNLSNNQDGWNDTSTGSQMSRLLEWLYIPRFSFRLLPVFFLR